jgi:TonB family protein
VRVALLICAAIVLSCATSAQRSSNSPSTRGRTSCSDLTNADTTVYDTTQVTEKPFARSGPFPRYPVNLRQRGIEGSVTLSVVVNADGRVDRRSITVFRGSYTEFEREAIRWAEGSLFWPGCLEGRPVRVRTTLPMDFKITRR